MRKIYDLKQIAASLLLKSRKMVKGSISLFLALVVTPLLGMTLMMVESIRYQDVIEEMIEINDLSAFATLGNYDPFIKERFGLLAVSQDEEIQDLYNKYFVENQRLVGNDIILKSCTIDGEYSLEDLEMMKLQVLEYAEYSAFFDAVFEGGNITELLDKLNEALNVDDLQTMTTVMENSADVCDAIAECAESILDLNDFITNKYYPALNDYKDAYDDFEDDLNDYIEELNDYSGDEDEIYDDDDVKDAWDDLADGNSKSLAVYKKACDTLADRIEDLVDKLDDVSSDLEDALEAYNDLEDALTNNDQQAFSVQTQFTMEIAGSLLPLMQAIADEHYDDLLDTADDLRDLYDDLKDLKMEDFDSDSDTDDTKDDWYVEIGSIESIADAISSFVTYFNQVDYEVDFSTLQDLIDAVVSFVDMPSMIDANCRAVIDYEKNTEPWLYDSVGETVTRIAHKNNDIANAVGIVAIAQLTACIEELKMPPNILQAIILSVEILIATTALSIAMVLWVQNVTINSVLRIVDIGEIWDHVLLAGYAAYNFPNRTNYMQSVDISGYNYGIEIYRDVCGQDMDNPGLTENWEAYASISGVRMLYSAITTGSALPQPNSMTFYGAEQEYLLCGWTNEVYNQCGAFYNILMLRLVLDLVPLFMDTEVMEMAEAATYFAPLVYILVLLGDAFLDTFILSNGGDLPLVKFSCYCTPSGVLSLAADLASLSDMTELVGEVLPICSMIDSGDFSGLNPFADGVLPFSSYTDHMFILFLICAHPIYLWDRVQNVVINESRAYYNYHGKSFDISKSYTYVHSEIVYDINPMFDFSSLTDSASVFTKTVHLDRHIGY